MTGDVPQSEIDQFHRGVTVGKVPPILGDFTGSIAMDVDEWGVVWAGAWWGGAHGRDVGSTAPTHTDPGAARARHNLTEPSVEPARCGSGRSAVVAGRTRWWGDRCAGSVDPAAVGVPGVFLCHSASV